MMTCSGGMATACLGRLAHPFGLGRYRRFQGREGKLVDMVVLARDGGMHGVQNEVAMCGIACLASKNGRVPWIRECRDGV